MIGTITLNPSIDIKYTLDGLELGGVFRCDSPQKTPGGKGLNVARVLKILGDPVSASGFLGGNSGEWISTKLKELDIKNDFQSIKGETRSCLNIISNIQTEILESGPQINKDEELIFLEKYSDLIEDFKVVCASGSLPKGLNKDFYRKLAEISLEKDVKFILDTSKDALLEGLNGNPYLVKPNIDELNDIFKTEIKTEDEIVKYGRKILKKGANNVVISLGAKGAILINKNNIYRGTFPKIKVINTVGSGDSMIAGIAHAINKGYSIEDAFKYSIACGTSNAMQNETGKIDKDQLNDLLKKIEIKKIDVS